MDTKKETNFEYLYKHDYMALIGLLYCRDKDHPCMFCEFKKYGFCPTSDECAEYTTLDWLAQERD